MRLLQVITSLLVLCLTPLGASRAMFAQEDQAKQPTVVLVATGGTIAMKIDPVKNAPVPALSGEELVATIPEISKFARIRVVNFSNEPSNYINPEKWVALAATVSSELNRPEVAGVIVAHGTDTLEETAWFLDLAIAGEKPIVLIGAQRNASEFDFDGPRNLLNAARICVSRDARGKGVMVALNGQINSAREVMKMNTSTIETFRSGDFGFIGVVDNDRVLFYRAPTRRQHVPLVARNDVQGKPLPLPRVEIVAMYSGADGTLVRAATVAGARGIVIQALGLGNMNVSMYEAVAETIRKGIPVVVSTRVPTGRVLPVYGFQGGGKTTKDLGAVFADDLSPQKARILLMLALQTTSDPAQLQRLFDR
jgi:L-asparaginase